jgi:hypothetical protein
VLMTFPDKEQERVYQREVRPSVLMTSCNVQCSHDV